MAKHSTQVAVLGQEAGASDALVLSTLLRRLDFGYRMAMRSGECLVLDNQRILHGQEGETDPVRRLEGCYVAPDWVKGHIFDFGAG